MSSEPLSTLMAAGPMLLDDVLRIGRQAAAALSQFGLHGELWPSAISVSPEGVGILPPGGADRNRYGQYAAPEVVLGKPATPASDVFSLGAILFHALAGRPAFRGNSATEVMLSACADLPLSLIELREDVPNDIAGIIHRCLMRDPYLRYATPAALHAALQGAESRGRWSGKRILVADDDAPIRDLFSQLAEHIGVEADVVSSGRDAVAAMKSRRYDVALLDLNMPRLSGWEVLDFLRTKAEARPGRLFIVTGFGDQHISEADRELVSAVIYKPVEAGELAKLVIACLRGGAVDVASILRQTSHRPIAAA